MPCSCPDFILPVKEGPRLVGNLVVVVEGYKVQKETFVGILEALNVKKIYDFKNILCLLYTLTYNFRRSIEN